MYEVLDGRAVEAARQLLLRCSTSCIPAVESDEPSDKFDGFEQHVCGAIGEGVFEFVDHQPIAIDAQALLGNRRASHIAA